MSDLSIDVFRRCIQQIAHHHSFLGAIGLGIKLIPSKAFPLLGSDASIFYINPDACKNPPYDDMAVIRFIIAHNILHTAFGHPFRLPAEPKSVQMDKWIQAQDIVVNNMLLSIQAARVANAKTAEARRKEIKHPLFRPPKLDGKLNITYDPTYTGWSAERIYVELIKGANPQSVSSPTTSGSSGKEEKEFQYKHKPLEEHQWDTATGSHTYFKPDTDEAKETIVRQHSVTINAVNEIKRSGHGTGDALRGLSEEISHEPSLEEALNEILISSEPGEISWSKPKRRWLPDDYYFPSEDLAKGAHLVIGIDVSGSIGQKELHEFWRIIKGSLTSGMRLTMDILSCDSRITSHHKVEWDNPESYEEIKDLPGGGGTDFRPIFTWQEENCPDAKAIIVFTDLCGSFPKNSDIPTFWLVDCALRGQMDVPFGQVIYFNPIDLYT